jgi:FkbM family methyltransferase
MKSSIGPYIFPVFRFLERGAAYFQGKGYGTCTVKQEVSTVLKQLGFQPKLAVDVGANIGRYSQELRNKQNDLEIHIFEPASFNLEKLRSAFFNDPLTIINPYGISNRSGNATLFSNYPGSGLGSLTKRRLDHFGINFDYEEDVKLIRFEDYWISKLNCRPVDIVKLDIEGHEFDALKGFGCALAATKVIQFEFGGCNIDSKNYFQNYFYFFKDNGFDLSRITPFGLEFLGSYKEIDEFFSTTNYVATNKNILR